MAKDETIEGNGFVVRDKRQFTTDGELKTETEAETKQDDTTGEVQTGAETQKEEGQKQEPVKLPEINFPSFILSLSSSALLHFGDIPDPISGTKARNLPMAKQTIDILGILKEKTQGNLSNDEEQLMDNLLHDLRIKYVEESKKG
jgi:hypothetical protein